MAQLSGFWTTVSSGAVGHQVAGYTQAQLTTMAAILASCGKFEGVGATYLNRLGGTVTGANTAQIDTGGAVVDGKWYQCGAAESINIPSAIGAGNTRIDRIVLRTSWADFKTELHRIEGIAAGSPAAPSITQTSGTTYDIMLYQALVDVAGTVTLTDERVWAEDGYRYVQTLYIASSQNFVKANYPWLRMVVSHVIGGGGGGGGTGATAGQGGGGGGGGGYSRKMILVGNLLATEAITIGATTAPTSSGTVGGNGSSGNTTSFGAHHYATGGAGGNGVAYDTGKGGNGGAGVNGDLNITGMSGQTGDTYAGGFGGKAAFFPASLSQGKILSVTENPAQGYGAGHGGTIATVAGGYGTSLGGAQGFCMLDLYA